MRDILKPSVVLFIICLVVSTALAFTYAVTKEVIEERAKLDRENARRAVLSEATAFEKIEDLESLIGGEAAKDKVKEAYRGLKNEDFVGYVFTLVTKGYGGEMTLAIGVDKEGKVSGVKIGDNSETPGLGAKAKEEPFISQFLGLTSGEKLSIVKGKKSKPEEIQAISGATITTKAVTEAVQAAIDVAAELMEKEGVEK